MSSGGTSWAHLIDRVLDVDIAPEWYGYGIVNRSDQSREFKASTAVEAVKDPQTIPKAIIEY
jgi:hypothetical protein